MSPRLLRTLTAFADALIPGGTIASASAFEVPSRIDAWLADGPAERRTRFRRALITLELAGVASRYVRPFSMLGPAARAGTAERLRRARIPAVRAAASIVASQVLNQWAAAPAVEQALDFTYACATGAPPRDAPALEVLSYPQIHRPHVEDCDVVVVGSGAAGAVVAADLAERGLTVVVVEEGGLHTQADLGGPPVQRARRLYRGAGMVRARGAPGVGLLMGMGLGGSTLVGYGSMYRTPDEVLLRWDKEHGLDGVDPGAMRPIFDRIERGLNVAPAPEALVGEAARRFQAAARARGAHGGPTRRAVDGCRGCGTCSVGCPSAALLGTHLSFLPAAQRNGATLFANARVERVLVADGRARGIVARMLEQRSREPKTTLTVRAGAVVLAAGALHTPALLAASALGNRSGTLGRGLSLMPAVTVGALFDEDLHAWRGIMQPFALDEWLDDEGVIVEVTDPLPSLDAATLPGAGQRLQQLLEHLHRYASATVTAADPGLGRVTYRAGASEPVVSYSVRDDVARHLLRGAARTSALWLAAGARAVVTPFAREPITSEAQARDLEGAGMPGATEGLRSTGPSGTARMGSDPATSVVASTGEVHGAPGVFVADASALPTCPRVAPQLTVMAMAARTAEHVWRALARG